MVLVGFQEDFKQLHTLYLNKMISTTQHIKNIVCNLFSSVEGVTIEKYIINQKTEKVKELLVYDELSLNGISFQLGYSSVHHLSNQFKKITGLTPSCLKKLKKNKRIPLGSVPK